MNDMITAQGYWNKLRKQGTGAAIARWSIHGGTMPGFFHILSVSESDIDIANPRRRIPRKVFEKMANQWDEYKQGTLARSEFGLSSYSIYVISILQWLDQTRWTAGVGLSGGGDAATGGEGEVGALVGPNSYSFVESLRPISAEQGRT